MDYFERRPTSAVGSESTNVFALVLLGKPGYEFVAIKTRGHFPNCLAIAGKKRTEYSLHCDSTPQKFN